METSFIDGAKRRITVGGSSDVNPLPASAENIRAGQRNFAGLLHGMSRIGWPEYRGAVRATKCRRPCPCSSRARCRPYTDGQLHWIIKNGIAPSGMPAARDIFHDEEIWQLVLYIRHLPPKGSLGEPKVYGGQ